MFCSRWIGLLVGLTLLGTSVAHGQVQEAASARIKLLNKKAMDEYDSLEFEAAKAALREALGVARTTNTRSGPELTQTYLNLGVVYGAGLNDRLNAVRYFTAALTIDPNAKLNPARATPALEEMFVAARVKVRSRPSVQQKPQLRHTPVDDATAGRSVRLWAQVKAPGLQRVLLYFRPGGTPAFLRVQMQQPRPGVYVGEIPARMVKGRSVHYYIEAQGAGGRRLVGNGSAASPNIISVTEGSGDGGGGGEEPRPEPASGGKVFSISVLVGTGVGMVTGGESEHLHPQVVGEPLAVNIEPGGAWAPFHLAPELTYHVTDAWHIGVQGRIQVVNATDEGGKISLLGLARVKRYFGDGAARFFLSLGAGAGQIRHRIPLGDYDSSAATPDDSVDTRVAGIGAFGVGGGLVYMFSSYVGLAIEANGLILVPDFAAHLDANLGLVLSL